MEIRETALSTQDPRPVGIIQRREGELKDLLAELRTRMLKLNGYEFQCGCWETRRCWCSAAGKGECGAEPEALIDASGPYMW